MSTKNRMSEWKKSSAGKAKQAIDAVKEAKRLALKTCKLADDLFKAMGRDAEKISKEIEKDANEEDDDYDQDVDIAEELGGATESLDVSEHTNDANDQLESIFDGLIGALEEAGEQIKTVGS